MCCFNGLFQSGVFIKMTWLSGRAASFVMSTEPCDDKAETGDNGTRLNFELQRTAAEDAVLNCTNVCGASNASHIDAVHSLCSCTRRRSGALIPFLAPSWGGSLAAAETRESRLWFQITTLLCNTFNISPDPTSFSLAFRYCHHPFPSTSLPCLFQVLQQPWPSVGKKQDPVSQSFAP